MRPPTVSLRAVVARVVLRVVQGPVLDWAAQTAFYAVLALAPFLVVLTSLAAFVPSGDTVARLLRRAEAMMPPEAYQLVEGVVRDMVAGRSAALITVSLATALWSAARAANALRKALNSAHELDDGRSWVRKQLVAVLVTIGGAALLIASVVATLLGTHALGTVTHALGFDADRQVRAWGLVRWPLAVFSVAALAAVAYRVLPDTRPRPAAVWAGAAVATVLFLASSLGFSAYAAHFGNYGVTYGSLAGGVVLLLWAWLAAIAFIVGGEVTAAFPGARPRRAAGPASAEPGAGSTAR